MSSKKKKSANTVSLEPITDQQQEPAEEFPIRQVDEVPIEEKPESESIQPEPEPVVQAESTSTVELAPAVEPVPETVEVVTKPEPPAKPKPLTMISLHAEIEELRKIVDGQATLIKQLMETPARQRKPPTSNGKVSILDTKTGKSYPSKNNVYQSLLKAGELDDLVKQGVFGSDPSHNSFGCYNLFRFYKDRFIERTPEETSVA
jgi:hypothetical protein